MNERIRAFREDLLEGLVHREYQFFYPQMTASYFDDAKQKYLDDPVFRARIAALDAGILHLLDKHGFLDAVRREDGELT